MYLSGDNERIYSRMCTNERKKQEEEMKKKESKSKEGLQDGFDIEEKKREKSADIKRINKAEKVNCFVVSYHVKSLWKTNVILYDNSSHASSLSFSFAFSFAFVSSNKMYISISSRQNCCVVVVVI